ncbi:MAG: T9SS type A sorting domain-containing protein, partial [Flavobacteriales bacterium]
MQSHTSLLKLMMRQLLKTLLLLAPLGASGQGAWTQVFPMQSEFIQTKDALELDNGQWLVVISAQHRDPPGITTTAHSWTAVLDADGQLQEIEPLTNSGRAVLAESMMYGTDSIPLHILGVSFDSVQLNDFGVTLFQMNELGTVTTSTDHLVGDGTHEMYFYDATLDPGNNIFLVGGVRPPLSQPLFLPNKMFLMRLGQDGQELGQDQTGTDQGLSIGQHAIRQDSLMFVSGVGLQNLSSTGSSKFMRFDTSFNYLGGYSSTSLSGSGLGYPPDSLMTDCLYMTPVGNGSIIVSSRFGYTSSGARAVLGRLSSIGQQEALFMPYSGAFSEFCAAYQGHEAEPDGNIVFSVSENYQDGPDHTLSDHSSRIHLFLLDTMLNVLCDQIAVDGALDSAYYYVNRVKATADGGSLIMGSRLDLAGNGVPQPWIMKVAPWDCNSGIAEPSEGTTATVWPNPGSQGFSIAVNGPTLAKGQLLLFDAQGQEVGSANVVQSAATMDTQDLAPSIYFYRIIDEGGKVRATGR